MVTGCAGYGLSDPGCGWLVDVEVVMDNIAAAIVFASLSYLMVYGRDDHSTELSLIDKVFIMFWIMAWLRAMI